MHPSRSFRIIGQCRSFGIIGSLEMLWLCLGCYASRWCASRDGIDTLLGELGSLAYARLVVRRLKRVCGERHLRKPLF